MSNTPSSPVVQRIQQSALLFVVLIFALGALILAATNISPKSAVRGNVPYTFWASPDGAISLEYPADWTLQPISGANALQYAFVVNPKDSQNPGGGFVVLSTLNVPANQSAEITIASIFANINNTQHPDAPLTPVDALVGGLKGTTASWSVTQSDPSGTNAPLTLYKTAWIAALDNSHFVSSTVQSLNPTVDLVKWAHTISTLHVNKDAALKALGAITAPIATSAATASGTEAATAQATANGTPEATQQATQPSTLQSTQAATP